jgi:predicted RNA-binding protein YlqC (UPF0109 family)
MGGMADSLQEYVEQTTKKIVDNPAEVEVTCSISTKAVIVQIRVEKRDCGKIIGKRGKTIDALKLLCLAIKNTNHPNDSRRVLLEVLEDENSDFTYGDREE